MRVAVTGANGRLGRALMSALEDAPFTGLAGPTAWTRQDFDLDDATPRGIGRLLERDRPEVVIHAAAWTDVDACARDPDLALRRNGKATGALAEALAARGLDLVAISTNEVFDGRRTDGQGYAPGDETAPLNPYGASKLEGEQLARASYASVGAPAIEPYGPQGGVPDAPQLAIVRTAWLFGPGQPDFPMKILAAAARAREAHEPLRAVHDETGSPTYVGDLAEAIVELLWAGRFAGLHHVVDSGIATRADWAREVLRLARVDVPVEEVPASTWTRASTPPRWAVLEPTPTPSGEPLRPWQAALAERMAIRR
jgi:dTDP-4-dehydrorhamnose reductase